MQDWERMNGDFYDGDERGYPETPYQHDYTKSITMKIAMSRPDFEGDWQPLVFCSIKKLRDFIPELNQATQGIPKILYLVGWQYAGHDTGYPAFDQVNPALVEKGEDAAEQLRSLMLEAKKHNTTISLHINMTDAYPDSPLWDEYIQKDLISRRKSGRLLVTGRWYKRKAYQVCYSREWAFGLTVKRIDALLDLLPIQDMGTVHIDAFFCRPNAYYGITKADEQKTRRKIFRYWQSRGVDVTSEFIYRECGQDDLIGLMPMVWHIYQKKNDYMRRPASLLCGGGINPDLRGDKKIGKLFGESTRGEGHFTRNDPPRFNEDWKDAYMADFFCNALPFQFLNSFRRLSVDRKGQIASFEKGIFTHKKSESIYKIHQGEKRILKQGSTLCIPALWEEHLLGVFSQDGIESFPVVLPEGWEGIERLIYEPVCGMGQSKEIQVKNQSFIISLSPSEGGWIKAL